MHSQKYAPLAEMFLHFYSEHDLPRSFVPGSILHSFQSHDTVNDEHQFGFKPSHSTSLGCSVHKQVVDYYRSNGSYVFACFLDLSKAFDSACQS